MEPEGSYQEYFNIWITPRYELATFRFYLTLAHELTHGYAGLKYGHNAHWRRWFYRVVWHLNEAKFFPHYKSGLLYDLMPVEYQYNQSPKHDPVLTTLEAFRKAENEHDQVMENYLKRVNA